jgi:ribosomal-protein-serine acetyltransferase
MDTELRTEFSFDDADIAIRAWRIVDADAVFDAVSRNRDHLTPFMHWMTPDYSRQSAVDFLHAAIAARIRRENLGLGLWQGTLLCGSIGFTHFDWNSKKTEIGYWIDQNWEGKGIITKATKALIDYAFDDLCLNRVEIHCSTLNTRSAAVPERLGFRKEGVLRSSEFRNGELHDFAIYGLLADDPRVW